MAKIAIFCDGTWNSPTMKQVTHVRRLFDKTPHSNAQHTQYFEGVGTGQDEPNFLSRGIMKLGGGAFGWGLNENIKRAYAYLCETYQPGDDIYIFGFSRGAYTARSLAGMIRKCGILTRVDDDTLDEAFRLYRRPGYENHPDALRILKQRRRMSPRIATSQADLDWRTVTPWDDDPDSFDKIEVAYLGIWDTVGSLGIPAPVLGPVANLWNRKYKFHDTKLSSMVKSARHAVALDERRVFYAPALWDNLEASRTHPGLNKGDRTENRAYQQVWFTGTHSIVGGSDERARKLTGQALEWIAEGAARAGLTVETDGLLDVPCDPLADSLTLSQPSLVYQIAGNWLRWRKGPGHPIDLHAGAAERVKARRDYRPRSLHGLMPELFGDPPVVAPPDRPEPGR